MFKRAFKFFSRKADDTESYENIGTNSIFDRVIASNVYTSKIKSAEPYSGFLPNNRPLADVEQLIFLENILKREIDLVQKNLEINAKMNGSLLYIKSDVVDESALNISLNTLTSLSPSYISLLLNFFSKDGLVDYVTSEAVHRMINYGHAKNKEVINFRQKEGTQSSTRTGADAI